MTLRRFLKKFKKKKKRAVSPRLARSFTSEKKKTKQKKRTKKKKTFKHTIQGAFAWFLWLVQPLHILLAILIIIAFCLIIRLYDLQIINGVEYRAKVESQYYNTKRDTIIERGDIFFTNKDGIKVLAATQVPSYTLAVNPSLVRDPEENVEKIAEIVEINTTSALAKMKKKNDPYEELVKDVSREDAALLRSAEINGLVLVENRKRFYPAGVLASEVVGFMSFTNDQLKGSYGLEKYYDDVLTRSGNDNSLSILNTILSGNSFDRSEAAESGHKLLSKEGSLVTTIEPTLQSIVEAELVKTSERWDSQYSVAIVMDTRTGAIKTMASDKQLDHNTERKHYRNHLIEDRLEVGSIIKPLAAAIALEEDAITTDFSYNDTGSVTIGRFTVRNFDGRGRGPFTDLQTVLTNSLNTGMAEIASRVDPATFVQYYKDLGLGVETSIDLPGEAYGFIDNIETKREIEIATASFGQGIAVAPIAALRALTSLANGGNLVTPYIVEKIEYGNLIPASVYRPNLGSQVFSPETTRQITNYLVNIVDDSATFSPYSDPNFAVAIKTGTAEIAKPGGGYYDDRYLHSIMGYFPAYAEASEPQFAILVMTMQPQGARFSSTTMKEPFFNIVDFIKNYYELTPDRDLNNQLSL